MILILPLRILAIIAGLLSAGSGVLLFSTFRRVLSLPVAALLSIFWVFSPLVQPTISHNGMEAGVNAFSIILFMFLLVKYSMLPGDNETSKQSWRRLFWLGAAAVMVMFSRLDNVFLVAAAGLWLIYRQNEQRYPVILGLVLSVASVFISFFLRIGFREAYIQYIPSIYWMLGLTLVFKMVLYAVMGLFDLPRGGLPRKDIIRVGLTVSLACGLAGGILLGVYQFGLFDRFPRTVIVIDWAISLAGMLIITQISRFFNEDQNEASAVFSPIKQLKTHFQQWLQRGSAYLLPVGGALLVYMAANKILFDTFSPVSGQIKHWWGTLYTVYGKPVNSLVEFLGYDARLRRGPWSLAQSGWYALSEQFSRWHWIKRVEIPDVVGSLVLLTVVIFILLAIFYRQGTRQYFHRMVFLPLLAGSLIQMFYYFGTGYVNTRDWYWVNQMLVILWLAAIFTELLYQRLLKWKIPAFVPILLMGVFSAAWMFNYGKVILQLVPPTVSPENEIAYMGSIQLLEQATEPGSIIGSTGGGNIAYFIKDRTIVNLDGLMNSAEYFESMQNGTASEFLDKLGMDYVFANAYMVTESDPYNLIFANRLERLDTFANATLFRYICSTCKE